MNRNPHHSANPLIGKVQQLFSRDLALENDYLRQENKILRSKLGARVPLSEAGLPHHNNKRVRVSWTTPPPLLPFFPFSKTTPPGQGLQWVQSATAGRFRWLRGGPAAFLVAYWAGRLAG